MQILPQRGSASAEGSWSWPQGVPASKAVTPSTEVLQHEGSNIKPDVAISSAVACAAVVAALLLLLFVRRRWRQSDRKHGKAPAPTIGGNALDTQPEAADLLVAVVRMLMCFKGNEQACS